ncbi:helix-turn-helix transcriptional regulator [Bdellovibrio sp. HCB2-146]|uniref:helix-turn-helix transcriptional regulator n=1 Tax=Bdellovibrio sp. HCB2-146 TaxID=3394362 RepID=UPI0039BC7DCC
MMAVIYGPVKTKVNDSTGFKMTIENAAPLNAVPFIDSKLGICIKDNSRTVTFQNEACKEICGNHEGQTCSKICSHLLAKVPDFVQGMHLHRSQKIDETRVDALITRTPDQILTLLYPLDSQEALQKKQEEYLTELGLTKSELNIMKHLLSGRSNAEIAEMLFISRSTLKTHLNNIYKKLPPEMRAAQWRGRGA